MTPETAWREVAERQITLVPALGIWQASVEVKGTGHNKKRNLRAVHATGPTAMEAVRLLCATLDAEGQPQSLFEQGECPF
jgi:hypothetical protein